MHTPWPEDFARIPAEPWTETALGELALKYDTVENHGWYDNLDGTVAKLAEMLADGDVLIDYSGGTGILASRLLDRIGERNVGILIADSSAKFLRVAMEKFKDEPRVAFRRIFYLKDEARLQTLDEVLEGTAIGERGADLLVSTNAVHLYYDLPDTLAAWFRVLKPGAPVLVQSGNIRNPDAADDEWIIDETVHAIHESAVARVERDEAWATWRDTLANLERMAAYDRLRHKFFLPVRPLAYYVQALEDAGFTGVHTSRERIAARVDDWYDFLAVYHEGVLGWMGGSRRVDGADPSEEQVQVRLAMMRLAMDDLFHQRDAFSCCWTTLVATRP